MALRKKSIYANLPTLHTWKSGKNNVSLQVQNFQCIGRGFETLKTIATSSRRLATLG